MPLDGFYIRGIAMQVRVIQRMFRFWIREPGEVLDIPEEEFSADVMEKIEETSVLVGVDEKPISKSMQKRLDAEARTDMDIQ
jgi:hypothetical protein